MGKSTIAQNIETRVVSIDKLNPSTYNPRVDLTESDAEYQHIKNSLESFGYLDPIVWNERTGNIISGHQRYKILVADGATELEVKVVDFDLETEKACNLAMNKTVGRWDDDKLDALLEEMASTDWGMSDFGFPSIESVNADSTVGADTKVVDDSSNGYKISYEIVFNNEDEQDRWYSFIKYLKGKYPNVDTISERIVLEIGEILDGESNR